MGGNLSRDRAAARAKEVIARARKLLGGGSDVCALDLCGHPSNELGRATPVKLCGFPLQNVTGGFIHEDTFYYTRAATWSATVEGYAVSIEHHYAPSSPNWWSWEVVSDSFYTDTLNACKKVTGDADEIAARDALVKAIHEIIAVRDEAARDEAARDEAARDEADRDGSFLLAM